jgi:hypothetical protein
MTLAVRITKIMRTSHHSANQLRDIIRIFQPETVRNILIRHGIQPAQVRKWFYRLASSNGSLQGTDPCV